MSGKVWPLLQRAASSGRQHTLVLAAASVRKLGCNAYSWRSASLKLRTLNGVQGVRLCSISAAELDKQINAVNSLFVEARELLTDALDSAGTKYFAEDLEDAQKATKECIDAYEAMLKSLDEKRRGEVVRSMGMKMEQLKGELGQILKSLTHDEELPTRPDK